MKRWSWAELPRFSRAVKACEPDAVLLIYIGWVYHYEFMVTFAPTICKKLFPNVPFVTRFENAMGADPRHTSTFSRAVRKFVAWKEKGRDVDYSYGTLLRDSDHIIVLSERHRMALANHQSDVPLRSTLIPPPVNMRLADGSLESSRSRGRKILKISNETFVVTYIGYLYRGKGLENLLRAFALVATQRSDVRLLILGGAIAPEAGHPDNYLETLHTLAQSLDISDRIMWGGEYTWDSDVTSLSLHASDVCVLPFCQGVQLNNSSFASVAAHGIPVITTRGEPIEEQFVHGENVYLCTPESPESLATAINSLAYDPGLARRLSIGVGKLAREWFSWERALDRTLEVCGIATACLKSNDMRNEELVQV
jgi:glycosyltransferase involved in cell wall biosynthesis